MNIGIDAYEANNPSIVGIGNFAAEIIKYLSRIDRENKYTIFLPNAPYNNLPPTTHNWHYRQVPSLGLWTFIFLPLGILTNKEKIDVFFSPTHYIPRFVRLPRVVSIMDLSYLHYPYMFRPKDLFKLKNWTAYSIENAQKIITISEFSKSEIIKYYQIPEDKIVVAYPGLAKQYKNININPTAGKKNNIENIKKKYNIINDYILFIGTLQPRKNIIRLLEAYKLASQGEALQNFDLVIVGKKGWFYTEIFEKVRSLKLTNRVKFLDFVSSDDMPHIYSQARCFILPSLYEGFGIPVVEAMACGVPTIISNTSSLPEVGGDGSIYIEPENIDSIRNGILKALNLPASERKNIIDKGFAQIRKFSWEKSAKIVLETLKDIQY